MKEVTMSKNVLIPSNLLVQIVELLGYWDISNYDRIIREDYGDVLNALNLKIKKLELRDAYSNIIRAKNEDDRHSARIEYLWQKNQISNEYEQIH
jgi:hypothetical protein